MCSSCNAPYMNTGLRIEGADKRYLRAALQDRLGRELFAAAKDGIKGPVRANKLSVPLKGLGAFWCERHLAQKVKAITANTPNCALGITPQDLFVCENGRLRLRYTCKQQVVQP